MTRTLIQFRPQKHVQRYNVLFFVLLFSLLNQWSRWLPVYLSSVTVSKCDHFCENVILQPVCIECETTDFECILCRNCRTKYQSWFYNFEDGVCMTSNEYGLINGFGFSFTFSIVGVIAGFVVDHKSINDRVTTILGVSAMACGTISLLYSICNNFYQVVILRAVLGAIQAFGAPASVWLITSHFRSASERPLANASYTVGLYMGSGLASLSTIFAGKFGWKLAFQFVGIFALLVSFAFEATVDLQFSCMDCFKNNSSSGNDSNCYDKEDTEVEGSFSNSEKSPLLRNKSNTTASSSIGSNAPSYTSSRPVLQPPSERLHDVAIEESKESQSNLPAAAAQHSYQLWGSVNVDALESQEATAVDDDDISSLYSESKEQVDIVAGEYLIDPRDRSRRKSSASSKKKKKKSRGTGGGGGGGHLNDNSPHQAAAAAASTDDFQSPPTTVTSAAADIAPTTGKSIEGEVEDVIEGEGFVSMLYTIFFQGKIRGTLPLLFFSSGVRFASGIVTFVYFPVLIARKFPEYENTFSVFNALVVLSCGSLSSFAGGRLGQEAVRVLGVGGLTKLVATSCLLCAPFFLLAFKADRFWLSVSLLSLGFLVGEAWMGATMALLQTLSPPKTQGLAMSLFLFFNWNFSALATDLVGYYDPGDAHISKVMVRGVVIPMLLAFVLFMALDLLIATKEIPPWQKAQPFSEGQRHSGADDVDIDDLDISIGGEEEDEDVPVHAD